MTEVRRSSSTTRCRAPCARRMRRMRFARPIANRRAARRGLANPPIDAEFKARHAGELDRRPTAVADADFLLCFDVTGKLEVVSIGSTDDASLPSDDLARSVATRLADWKLDPIQLDGKPTAACSWYKFYYPAARAPAFDALAAPPSPRPPPPPPRVARHRRAHARRRSRGPPPAAPSASPSSRSRTSDDCSRAVSRTSTAARSSSTRTVRWLKSPSKRGHVESTRSCPNGALLARTHPPA